MHSIINGKPHHTLEVTNRSFQFGDGIFETCRVQDNKIILWEYHKTRLLKGVKHLHITLDYHALITEINHVLSVFKSGVLKIIISRGDSKRGYGYDSPLDASRILLTSELPKSLAIAHISLCSSGYGLDEHLAGIKHQNRLEQVVALASNNNTECVMMDSRGYAISTTSGNFFIIKDNTLITPNLKFSGIKGTRRAYIMDNYPVLVKNILLHELLDATEVFTCNSIFGIRSILAINDTHFDTTFTQSIQEKLGL